MLALETEIRQRDITGIIDLPEIAEGSSSATNVFLCPMDFPATYRSPGKLYAHPDDYKILRTHIPPNLFAYRHDTRSRLLMRLSFQLAEDDRFVAASFVVDTGCSYSFLFSDELWRILSANNRIVTDEVGTRYVQTTLGGTSAKCLVSNDVPDGHKPANFIGLPMFFLLGVKFQQTKMSALKYENECSTTSLSHVDFTYI